MAKPKVKIPGGEIRKPKDLPTARSGRIPYVEDIARVLDCNPFEILCRFANGDYGGLGLKKRDIGPDLRFLAAKEAAQYIHPKRKAVEHSGPDGGPIDVKTALLDKLMQNLEDLAVSKAQEAVEDASRDSGKKKSR